MLEVVSSVRIASVEPLVESKTSGSCRVCTDESNAYNAIAASGRDHQSVCHSKKEYAKDLDGDGHCEVHCNSTEGLWTELRNFLRPFKGVHKRYMAQYVAVFEMNYNAKRVSAQNIQMLCTQNYYL